MSLVQDGTGNDDFAGVTCLPALQNTACTCCTAAARPCAAAVHLLLTSTGAACHKPADTYPELLLAILLWGDTGNTAHQLIKFKKYNENKLLHGMTIPSRQSPFIFDQGNCTCIWL